MIDINDLAVLPNRKEEERLFSLYSIIDNAGICPVVYEILEDLKKNIILDKFILSVSATIFGRHLVYF